MKRLPMVLGALWLLMGAALVVFDPDLHEAIWVGKFVLQGLFVLGGFGLLRLCLRHRQLNRAGTAAVTLLATLGVAAFFSVAFRAGEQIRFRMVRVHYEHRVAEIIAAYHAGQLAPGRDYQIDPGPPVRIAFYWQRGVLDEWVGLIHDPTATNLVSTSADPIGAPRLETTPFLFGDRLSRTRRLADGWYLGWFV